ncbi:MAG TPA: glycosyltransferase, partial [Methanomassiliicoccaceae archaeon]|nr:glycosyltransferase [Methanomassiliicoccaceae archaeon]
MRKKLLFISGSIGLGHVGRDIEIAREVRARRPHTDIVWIADEPARSVLRAAGENVAPESTKVSFGTERVERSSRDLRANMTMIGVDMMQDADANAAACREVIRREEVDLVIGDETFDLLDAISRDRPMLRGRRMVLITDFLGFEPVSENPLERTYARYANAVWYRMMKDRDIVAKCLFVGVPEDVPKDGWSASMPAFKDLKVDHVGYVLPFKPENLRDKARVRTSLGYGEEPLIVCTAGGTSVGRPLLQLCIQAYPFVRERLPDARMVVVGGPRIQPGELEVMEGVTVKGYVPELYRHLAACDIAVITAGATTSLELIALGRPFIYFPVEAHFEQSVHVSNANMRRGADLRMTFSQTDPRALADAI